MDKEEKERWLIELDRRKTLWERKKIHAEKRMSTEGYESMLGNVDLGVAEAALKRIATKRDEILGVVKEDSEPESDVSYPEPAKVAKKEEEPEREISKPKKERIHAHPKGIFGGKDKE